MIPTDLQSYYRLHARIYDLTRWSFLFGRNSLRQWFPELPKGARILDLGCGTGKQLHFLQKRYPSATITGIDQSPEMLQIAGKKISGQVTLRNTLYEPSTFPEHSFELIVASYSLSMVDDLEAVLKALQLHLTPGGYLLVVDFDSTPFHWFNRWMERNHVHFDNRLFEKLQQAFCPQRIKTKRGYWGLYRYSFFWGNQCNSG